MMQFPFSLPLFRRRLIVGFQVEDARNPLSCCAKISLQACRYRKSVEVSESVRANLPKEFQSEVFGGVVITWSQC